MTDQPTDHRAEAERWLALAGIDHADGDPPLTGVVPALIGIGHALLAGLLEPIEREFIPVASRSGICPRCGRDDHPESAHDEAAARIAGRDTDTRYGMTPLGPQEPE